MLSEEMRVFAATVEKMAELGFLPKRCTFDEAAESSRKITELLHHIRPLMADWEQAEKYREAGEKFLESL